MFKTLKLKYGGKDEEDSDRFPDIPSEIWLAAASKKQLKWDKKYERSAVGFGKPQKAKGVKCKRGGRNGSLAACSPIST